MKLGPVTKTDKRNKATSKKIGDDVMSVNCDDIVMFFIYGQFRVIRKPDSRYMVCKTYIFINSNFLSYKTHTIAWSKNTIYDKKCFFCKKCRHQQN